MAENIASLTKKLKALEKRVDEQEFETKNVFANNEFTELTERVTKLEDSEPKEAADLAGRVEALETKVNQPKPLTQR